MTNGSPFPPRPQAGLDKDEFIAYLLEHQRRGYAVYQAQGANGAFEIALDDVNSIKFNGFNARSVQVQGYALNNIVQFFDCNSMLEVKRAVDALAQQLIGVRWRQSPTAGRVREGAEATNLTTISNLVGTSSVQTVFDPYLENRSLAALVDILSFGRGTVADGVRVLSTSKTTTGNVPRLTKAGFDAWLNQTGITGEIRIMGNSEHRRFILLSGGQSLLLGPSLNSIHKNEAVRLEPDAQDRAFFDQVWAQATPLT
jgi:hypothetical protein